MLKCNYGIMTECRRIKICSFFWFLFFFCKQLQNFKVVINEQFVSLFEVYIKEKKNAMCSKRMI